MDVPATSPAGQVEATTLETVQIRRIGVNEGNL